MIDGQSIFGIVFLITASGYLYWMWRITKPRYRYNIINVDITADEIIDRLNTAGYFAGANEVKQLLIEKLNEVSK